MSGAARGPGGTWRAAPNCAAHWRPGISSRRPPRRKFAHSTCPTTCLRAGSTLTLAAARYRATLFSRLAALGVEFLQKLSLILIALVGVGAVIGGTMTLGQYIAFNLLSMQLGAPVLRIAAYRRGRDEQQLAARAEHQLAEYCGGDLWIPGGSLVLPAQRQITLHVDGMATTRGSGETERFVRRRRRHLGRPHRPDAASPRCCGPLLEMPRHGNVRINGLPVAHIERQHLARQLRLVGQRPVLFSASMAENIRLGDPAASPQQIAAVARVSAGNCRTAAGASQHAGRTCRADIVRR